MRKFAGFLPVAVYLAVVVAVYGLTPRERQLAQHAKTQLDEAIAHDDERTKEVDGAKQETAGALEIARLAANSAQTAGERAETAEKAVKDQHDELVRCATENEKMRKIVKAVSGPWWFPGLNALIYGVKKSVLSLLVIIAIVVVIGICLKIFAPGVYAMFGLAGKATASFGGRALDSAKRYLPKRKTKPKD